MLVGAVNIFALAMLLVAAGSSELAESDRLRLVAAGAGVIASVALIVSAAVLASGWTAWVQRFDVTAFVPLDKWGRGGFPCIALFSWPYEAIGLGGFCLYVFGRKLYRLAWIAGWI